MCVCVCVYTSTQHQSYREFQIRFSVETISTQNEMNMAREVKSQWRQRWQKRKKRRIGQSRKIKGLKELKNINSDKRQTMGALATDIKKVCLRHKTHGKILVHSIPFNCHSIQFMLVSTLSYLFSLSFLFDHSKLQSIAMLLCGA